MRQRTRIIIGSIFFFLLLVLLVAHRIIESRLKISKPLLVESFRHEYGMRCDVEELAYRFPDGVSANGVGISLGEKRLVEAREVILRVRLNDMLRSWSFTPEILKSIEASGVSMHLKRSVGGEWNVPFFSGRAQGTQSNKRTLPSAGSDVRCSVKDFTVDVVTQRGALKKQYERVEVLFNRRSGMVSLAVDGYEEKLKLDIRMAPEHKIYIQADSLSLQPLYLFTSPFLPFERLYMRGKLQIQKNSAGCFTFTASGSFFGKGPDESLNIQFDVEGKGTQRVHLEETKGTISLFGEKVDFSLVSTKERKPTVKFTAVFPDFSYERIVAAVPLSLRPHLPDLKVSGSLKGTFSAIIDIVPPHRTSYRFTGESRPLRVLSLGPRIRIFRLKYPFLHTLRTEEGKIVSLMIGPENPDYTPYEEIPPDLIRAVITAEDGSFFRHRGVSIPQVIEAMADNIRAGRVVRGASTITMQLAKNLYLGRERTFRRKFEELFIAHALEQELSKERILEIYLNIIEWGDGVYGIAQAARYYFQKTPRELTEKECAFLASIIARPKDGWEPDPLARIGPGWQQYLDLIVRKMREKGITSKPSQ